ncbi:MAG: hypothetical protein A2787_09285 [Omnitrophica WOR_2 bacterium RIFCSPHIGHO2_01_FULL_48_9]|nr:MAG: hypothetical protein A3D10_03355 [Omnitrophica WOR_2 bacterium RIFCSPHIGHO2_02_FULL_48_11]OGX30890.1 MAG: hypothetical protein A2787_09285 [Omnitrophica WOR_2 bacterium RIFCSPHIGHO2_01_FULL_48_9]
MTKRKKVKSVFLSSIHQNAGKTTMALGLYKIFKERKLKTAFMKPIGQQYVHVGEFDIDKDSYLIGALYHFRKRIKDMSPITIGRGFTEKYIFNPQSDELRSKIVQSFNALTSGKDAIIVEGTGHAGVGSVIDLSNADVASLLGSKVIIVSEGGIGKSIDEIMLNKALFDLKGVEVLGVIVNKVLAEKYEKIKKTVEQGLKNKGIRLLGMIPWDSLLKAPTVEQVRGLLGLKLLCGEDNLDRRVHHTIVAAMEPQNMINYLKEGTLVLISGDRIDNIMVAVSSHLITREQKNLISGIILTGDLIPSSKIIEMLKKSRMPVLLAESDTYSVAAKLEHLICKIQKTDKDKITEATALVKKHVNVDLILENM